MRVRRRMLSLWQPWATLLVVADPITGRPAKGWETRHWMPRPSLPIEIAIHATQRLESHVLNRPDVCDLHRRLGPIAFPRGAIIGTATITEVVAAQVVTWKLSKVAMCDRLELALGDYTSGRYAWRIENPRALPNPIPFRGVQTPLLELPEWADFDIDLQLGLVPA